MSTQATSAVDSDGANVTLNELMDLFLEASRNRRESLWRRSGKARRFRPLEDATLQVRHPVDAAVPQVVMNSRQLRHARAEVERARHADRRGQKVEAAAAITRTYLALSSLNCCAATSSVVRAMSVKDLHRGAGCVLPRSRRVVRRRVQGVPRNGRAASGRWNSLVTRVVGIRPVSHLERRSARTRS